MADAFRLLFLLLPLVSCLIMPMTKPNGDPDMTSIISHMTLMEQTIADLLTQVHTTTTELATVKSTLRTTEDEVKVLQEHLRSAEIDIAGVQHDLQKDDLQEVKNSLKSVEADIAILKQNPDAVNFALLKSEVEVLKVSNNGMVPVLNLTAIEAVNADVEANKKDIQSLKSEILTTQTELNKTTDDLMAKHNEIDNLVSQALDTNINLNQTTADVQAVNSQVGIISGDVKHFSQELLAVKSKIIGNDVAFQVSQDQGYESGWTVLTFDTVHYNEGNAYNKTSGLFTAPVSGTYIFWANINFYHPSGNKYIFINIGLKAIGTGFAQIPSRYTDERVASVMTVTHLDKGTEVYFKAAQTSYAINSGSSFGGALLHAS